MGDIDFKELEKYVIKEFQDVNKRTGKATHPMDIVETSARVAAVAIRKYHEEVLRLQRETP